MAAEETRLEADRRKALGLAISQIEKQLGKGSIMRMGSESARVKVAAIPTGAINLDAATGVGGIPRGRITEIYGPESSGKTTLTLHLAANVQKLGGVAAYVDAEHALDIDYAKKLGVNIEDLLVSQPDTGEQALEIVEILVRSGAVDIVVIDSVAALVPKAEIEGEMGDSHVGLQARLMSQALRKLAGAINRSNCAVVWAWLSAPVILRRAWDIRRACRPTWLSPISPSISARGTSAATESITRMSSAPDRISMSAISSACSPVSGWDTSSESVSTPSLLA